MSGYRNQTLKKMKYILATSAFFLSLLILNSFDIPFFWKIVASGIVASGIFFGFDSHKINDVDESAINANLNDIPDDLSDYVLINEYNKKHGMPTNDIKEKITSGELNGIFANGIWYIHSDEM